MLPETAGFAVIPANPEKGARAGIQCIEKVKDAGSRLSPG
jgi:hypothetical protein